MRVLYDGWSLVYQPNSPQALHLLGILAALPVQVEAILALPGEPPAWLDEGITTQIVASDDTERARLKWEQRTLLSLRQRLEADLLHLTTSNPPLFGGRRNLVSPSTYEEVPGARTFSERLRSAASQGGMSRLAGLLWPEDLSPPDGSGAVLRLPVAVFPSPMEVSPTSEALDLPDHFILYHGPQDKGRLRLLLSAWSWAAGSLGDGYPLVTMGFSETAREQFSILAASYGLGDSVRSLPALTPAEVAETYRRSAALFHPATEPPWGGPVRRALAYGCPVAALEDPRSDLIAGAAGYLVKADSRLLGAALISVLVEEEFADKLSQAAKQRAADWSSGAFGDGLLAAYKQIIEG